MLASEDALLNQLNECFGHPDFLPGQKAAVHAVIESHNVYRCPDLTVFNPETGEAGHAG